MSAHARLFRLVIPLLLAGLLLAGLFLPVLARPVPKLLAEEDGGQLYPYGSSLVPLGLQQAQLDHAYQALFAAVYRGRQVAWTAATATYQGKTYLRGTLVGMYGLSGDFTHKETDGSFSALRAHILRPARIAVFYSLVRDSSKQVVTWEEATFETLFRVYLWGDYFDTINENDIRDGKLADYDLLIIPSITIGYADQVANALGASGRATLAEWVQNGGTLYAQGDGCYLAEATGLAPAGTVRLEERLSDLAPYDNVAHLEVLNANSPLVSSWLADETYILDDPVLSATVDLAAVAVYSDTTRPGTPAILYGQPGRGQVILTNAHPSVRQSTYPLALDAILLGMSERVGLTAWVEQQYSPNVAGNLVPAYEGNIPLVITAEVRNYWNTVTGPVVYTETVRPGFTVAAEEVIPPPENLEASPQGTTIVWKADQLPPGVSAFQYTARTLTDTLSSGWTPVATAAAEYGDPFTGQPRPQERWPVYVQARMAARLNGDRDIELDGLYPLPAEGAYFDIALTLENKEETEASGIVITDVVALLSPIVDVDDQRLIPSVLTDTTVMAATGETLWAANEVFFYHNASYPLPDGITDNETVLNLSNWDGVTVYTFTNELQNQVTIPPTYTAYISITPEGALRLPAAVLTYTFGNMQGYDYLDPAVRYGVFSQELFERQVSFASDPMIDQGVVLNTSGGTVFTNLGGHPIPYHEYLSSGIVTIPPSPYTTTVAYRDIWERPHQMDLRTVSYDIVPFPPPEYHAVVNTTFEMKVDWDGDGQRTDRVLEYPSRQPADLHLMLKSHSNFDPTMPPLRKDETLISQGMFNGVGYRLAPASGDWQTSWSFRDLQLKGPDATVLTDIITTPAYTYLYFQQVLDSQAYEVIDITGTLSTPTIHREGVLKVNDGARFVYHQKAVGPSRYEVFDSHVQAVFGLRSDAEVSKRVAPVRVATYEDSLYHFIKVEDPWEPRLFEEDPYIQSYGFGDMAATVFVGGRHQRSLLWARVNPGESTQVRLEINNNTGLTLTNVSIVPIAPPGFTVTLRSYTETTKIEPLFFDFPFLNATTIPDAWKGVYYFDVEVADPFPGEPGKVQEIRFTLKGKNIPAGFAIPPARVGIKDANGEVQAVFGYSEHLTLNDKLPSWVTLKDARIANETEMQALVDAINYDDAHHTNTAELFYNSLRDGVTTTLYTVTQGTGVAFTLPDYARTIPWDDSGERAKTLYVILSSDIHADWSGTALADYAPVIGYWDDFNRQHSNTGAEQSVEAHGALISTTFQLRSVNGQPAQPGQPLMAGVQSDLEVQGRLTNLGDDISAHTLVTYTLPPGVLIVTAVPTWTAQVDDAVAWMFGDLGPRAQRTITLTLTVSPTLAQAGTTLPLVAGGRGDFLNIYAQRQVHTEIPARLGVGVASPLAYQHDFEGTPLKGEWCLPRLSTTPDDRHFLGEFNNHTACLTLRGLPYHNLVHLSFDLYLLRSWDGNVITNTFPGMAPEGEEGVMTVVGPDIWQVGVAGAPPLLRTTFSNWDDSVQAYPASFPVGNFPSFTGASEVKRLGYKFKTLPMDSVYHLEFDFTHTAPSLALRFIASGLQEIGDESWGLDNVQVTLEGGTQTQPYRRYLPITPR